MRIVLVLLLASSLQAGEVVDNAAVVRMVRAGLSIDVVMTKIAQAQTAFDTSVDALIALKSEGVPDAVIKTMLVNAPAPAAAATPVPPPVIVQPKPPTDALCVQVQYYTLAEKGWGWTPSLLCASATGIDVDEQNIAYEHVTTHCFVMSALPRAEQEWWFSDGMDTYKFHTRGTELQAISAFIARVRSGIQHGSCSDRAIRKLLATTAQ